MGLPYFVHLLFHDTTPLRYSGFCCYYYLEITIHFCPVADFAMPSAFFNPRSLRLSFVSAAAGFEIPSRP
jgi:hypothetical protein